MTMYPNLFSSWQLGGVPLRNRLAYASILTHFAKDGQATQKLLNYLSSRAKGGAGLIVTEPLAMLSHLPAANRVHAYSDNSHGQLKKLVDAVELYDTRLLGQIQDAGRGRHAVGRNDGAVGPSPLPDDLSWTVPRVLSTLEIHELIEEWANSSQRLQRAGFSGVEISAGHGHLFHQFLSPHANKRNDEFGGDLDGRALFVVKLIQRIREVCGRPFIIGIKLVASDGIAGSINLEEAEKIARKIADCGDLDYWTFVWGSHSNTLWQHLPGAEGPRAPYLSDIKRLRAVAPCVATGALGYITDPNEAETALSNGTADLVFLGRAMIADPAWGEKALKGQEDKIRYCVSCNTCWRMTVESGGMACDNNPTLGLDGEAFWRPEKTKRPFKILVVGSGVAGLESAWVAAARGHSVTVLGSENLLGGKTRLHACLPGSENLSSVYDYQYTAGKREGVNYILDHQASVEDIRTLEPDRIILATGATMLVPEFVPKDYVQEGFVRDLRSLVAYIIERKFNDDGRIIVFDRDHTEMTYAAAEFFCDRFAEVIIVTPRDRIASDCSLINRQKIYHRLHSRGVKIIANHEPINCDRLDQGLLAIRNVYNNSIEELHDISAITYSNSRTPNDELLEPLKNAGFDIVCVGDCFAPRSLLAATGQGFSVGCDI